MKRKLAGLTACAMLLTGMAWNPLMISAEEGTEGTYESLTYMNYGDHIEITDCSEEATEVVVPSEIDGVPVTVIGSLVFDGCNDLASIILPEGITTIESHSFTYLDALTELILPESLVEIEGHSFIQCTALQEIRIPANVTSIGTSTFSSCTAMQQIIVDEANAYYKSVDGVLFTEDGSELLNYPAGKTDTAYTIPEGTQTLTYYSFVSNPFLTELTFPASLTECTEYNIFNFNDALTDFHVNAGSTAYKEIDGVLYTTEDSRLVCYPKGRNETVYEIPAGTGSIGSKAFSSDYGLVSVIVPEGVTSIGSSAFYNCKDLQSISLPEGLTTIDESAFNTCMALTDCVLPSTVTEIGQLAFTFCSSLKEINLPPELTAIEHLTFGYCSSLESIDVPDQVTYIDSHSFMGCTALTEITIPVSLTSVGMNSFGDTTALTDVYYDGSEDEWNAITFKLYNEYLLNATIHFAGGHSIKPGDLSEDDVVDASDAAILLIAAAAVGAGMESGLTEEQIAAADLNADGTFDAVDAALILQFAAYAGAGGEMTLEEFLEDLNSTN